MVYYVQLVRLDSRDSFRHFRSWKDNLLHQKNNKITTGSFIFRFSNSLFHVHTFKGNIYKYIKGQPMYFQQCVLVLFMSTLVPFEHDFTDNCFPFFLLIYFWKPYCIQNRYNINISEQIILNLLDRVIYCLC